MKYLKQFLYILSFSFLGELLNAILPLPIPGSIYGMLLLFLALCLKWIKLDQIQETANYLLSIMLIMFVPAGVGIMDTFFQFKTSIIPIILIVFISTFTVMAVTGLTTQFIAQLKNKKMNNNGNNTSKDKSKKLLTSLK